MSLRLPYTGPFMTVLRYGCNREEGCGAPGRHGRSRLLVPMVSVGLLCLTCVGLEGWAVRPSWMAVSV